MTIAHQGFAGLAEGTLALRNVMECPIVMGLQEVGHAIGLHGGGWVGDKKTKMSQSAVIFDEKSNYPGHDGMSLTINGGTFVGFDHSVEIIPGDNEPNVTINGGAFVPTVA